MKIEDYTGGSIPFIDPWDNEFEASCALTQEKEGGSEEQYWNQINFSVEEKDNIVVSQNSCSSTQKKDIGSEEQYENYIGFSPKKSSTSPTQEKKERASLKRNYTQLNGVQQTIPKRVKMNLNIVFNKIASRASDTFTLQAQPGDFQAECLELMEDFPPMILEKEYKPSLQQKEIVDLCKKKLCCIRDKQFGNSANAPLGGEISPLKTVQQCKSFIKVNKVQLTPEKWNSEFSPSIIKKKEDAFDSSYSYPITQREEDKEGCDEELSWEIRNELERSMEFRDGLREFFDREELRHISNDEIIYFYYEVYTGSSEDTE